MKGFSTILLGLGLAVGLAATAQATPMSPSPYANQEISAVDGGSGVHPHHPCHGASAGTAEASCGTLTGGPSGGLF